jgi:predicted secreted protein
MHHQEDTGERMTYLNKLALLILFITLSPASFADDSARYNRVSFQVSEQQEIDNDEIIVTMGVERNQQDPTRLSDEINKIMERALATAKKFPSVTRSGSDYSIRAIYSRDKQLDHWRGSSTLRLKSSNASELATLIKELQQQMVIKSTANSVSTDLMDKTVEKMTGIALEKFSARAEQITQRLGYRKYRLVSVNINNSGKFPRPVFHADMVTAKAASADRMSPPAFESGKSTVTVNVTGTIELQVTP